MPERIELGLDTFGDVTETTEGTPVPHAQVVRDIVEQAKLADSLGVDIIGIGEHHRADYAVSAPDIVMSAIAAATHSIKVTSAVTVLSSDDPVRIFERFSTINAISNGRAEVTLGRGSFTESFPLFGFDLRDYEALFSEKLDLFRAILDSDSSGEPFSWSGTTRASVENQLLFPPTEQPLKAWIAVGGSPESVVRAAHYKLPLMLAIIGGSPSRFRPYVDLFHRANQELGNPALPIGVHSPGHIAETDEKAREQIVDHWMTQQRRIGTERGWAPPTVSQFEREIDHGSLYVGSPETVAQRIADTVTTLGLERFNLKYANGPVPHEHLMTSIELYATQVIPRVREILAKH